MRTVALRFAENFSPEGTITAHQEVIQQRGSVWYGKFGSPVSAKNVEALMSADDPMILLIRSGGTERWWAHIDAVQRERPDKGLIPDYYDSVGLEKFKCWFHVTSFERAERDVMSKCVVPSSGRKLNIASRHSMSPYFVIEYEGADLMENR